MITENKRKLKAPIRLLALALTIITTTAAALSYDLTAHATTVPEGYNAETLSFFQSIYNPSTSEYTEESETTTICSKGDVKTVFVQKSSYLDKNVPNAAITKYAVSKTATDFYYSYGGSTSHFTSSSFQYDSTRGIYYAMLNTSCAYGQVGQLRYSSASNKSYIVEASYSHIVHLYDDNAGMLDILSSVADGTLSNLNPPEITTLDDFTLLNFQCTNEVVATWSGINCPDGIDEGSVVVSVKPSFFIILESGEELEDFNTIESPAVQGQNYFHMPYDDFFVGNPYSGRCMLTLTFTPSYYDINTNIKYNGKQITVTFDEGGDIKNVNLPESSLVAEHNSDFYLNNFTSTNEFHNWGDCFVHCYWNGATIPEGVNYVYSDIKVQLYARIGENTDCTYDWIDYELDDIVSVNSNRMDFNLTELDTYCRENGYRFYDTVHQWKNEKIRITPYYKTGTEYVYGRSVEIALTSLGGIESILQSQGDALGGGSTGYDDLESDYFTDNSVLDSMLDDVFNPDDSELNIDSLTNDFFSSLSSFFKACGQFPSLVASVFFFLPSYYANMLTLGLAVVIIMRILGR